MFTPTCMRALIGLCLCVAICAGLAAPSIADDEFDYADMDLEDLLNVDLVYGASKYQQTVTEAPAKVTVITAEEIRGFGYRTLTEALNGVGGFFTTNDRSYDYLGVRGFARPSDYNTRLLMLVDGHRVNDNIYDSATIGMDFLLDLDLVERIEIVAGPGSSLYGTNAFFGVINIVTREPDEAGVEIAAGGMSHEAYLGRATWNGRAAGANVMVSLAGLDSRGPELYFPEFDTSDQNQGRVVDGDYEDYQSIFLKTRRGGWSFMAAHHDRNKGLPTAAWETVFGDTRTRVVDAYILADLAYKTHLGLNSDVEFRAFYDQYDYEGHYFYDYAEDGDPPDIVDNVDIAHGRSTGVSAQFTSVLGRHKLVAGTDLVRDLRQDQSTYDADPYWMYLDDKRDGWRTGLFLQDEWRVLERLRMNLGLRYDAASAREGHLSPRAAVVHEVRSGTTVKGMWGKSYRNANAFERYYHDGSISSKPSPNLSIETIETFELIVAQNLGPRTRATLSAFRNDLEGLIDQYIDPADDLIVYRNAGRITSRGIEAELETSRDGWRARMNYSYQRTREQPGDVELTNSPMHMASAHLLAPLAGPDVLAGASARYMSERLTFAGDHTSAHVLVDLNLAAWNLIRGVGVRATVLNVFDRHYGDPGSTEHTQDILMRDGRTLRILATWKWQ